MRGFGPGLGASMRAVDSNVLVRLIERYQPALRIHGHMHDPVDERLGKTRLVANPAGYAHERKRGFNPALCIDLETTET